MFWEEPMLSLSCQCPPHAPPQEAGQQVRSTSTLWSVSPGTGGRGPCGGGQPKRVPPHQGPVRMVVGGGQRPLEALKRAPLLEVSHSQGRTSNSLRKHASATFLESSPPAPPLPPFRSWSWRVQSIRRKGEWGMKEKQSLHSMGLQGFSKK